MKETLEKLWNEYFWEECAAVSSDEERNLIRITVQLHEKVDGLLNEEQKASVEKYVCALRDVEALFVRKAFFKGCEFASAFFLDAVIHKR